MAKFPKIQSPCPYKSDLAAVMDGDFCRMCERNVFDLTGWSDGERVAFLAGCQEEVCVSYRIPVRSVLAAVAIASAALPAAAAAQDGVGDVSLMPAMASAAHDVAAAQAASMQDFEIFVGGIRDPANAEYVDVEAERALAALPIVYEDDAAKAPEQPAAASGTR
jgi:predicted Fe-S protein YdhL (DUF1289 family)